MDINRFWFLTGRHLAGEASQEEEAELQQELSENREYKARFDALSVFWGKSKQRDAVDVEDAFSRVRQRLHTGNTEKAKRATPWTGRFTSLLLKTAAAVTLIVVAGYFIRGRISPSNWNYYTWQKKYNGAGERSKIALPDGTVVWLNSTSELRFPDEFPEKIREVYLSGEAFFDVSKNASKPFVIHVDNGDVSVLGTSFNVKAFSNEAYIETSVVSGKVAFIPIQVDAVRDTIFLTKNYKAIVSKTSGHALKQEANTLDDRAWVDGKIVFRSNSLHEVGRVLERNFGKKLILKSPGIENCKLTATFQNNTLEEIVEMISTSKDYQFDITDKEVHLHGAGCDQE